jgi:tetratricopeptide (TPR) repeat protein
MSGGRAMAITIFISIVSDEFRAYGDHLDRDLTRHNVAVKVQEHFKDLGGDTLDKLDVYIADCHGVVHLVGHMTGFAANEREQQALLGKYSDLSKRLPPLGEALKNGVLLAYTQWEAWLALYHSKPLFIAKAGETAEREASFAPTEGSRAAQAAHLARLKDFGSHCSCEFTSPDHLVKHIFSTKILDLLVEDFAKRAAQERDIANGFIEEMAKRVAGDKALNLDAMKQAVQNAIEIYEKEIAGRPIETNLDGIVNRALASARAHLDRGLSSLARATLRKAAEDMRRDEDERRGRYEAGVTALLTHERDIALATYNGHSAAAAVVELARSIHDANASIVEFLDAEAQALYEYGRDRGSNVHLVAAIALRRELLGLASSGDERGAAFHSLGTALSILGERESGTTRLEEALSAHRSALQERTRDRVPLDWAKTQHRLGCALWRLGERERGTEKLEQAVAAFSAALEEQTRELVPLEWAQTQSNYGSALRTLGERERGTSRLKDAIVAFRAALEVRTREHWRDWATTQNNLGNALRKLGEWESGTLRLEEAILAFRSALEERTRERAPLDWAVTQNNLGVALMRLGERQAGTGNLDEAITAYRIALEELVRERVPLQWAQTQNNLGLALSGLGERESGAMRLDEAVTAYRAAFEERTRERVPLEWAQTQNNYGSVLRVLGERECGTARLDEAVAACRAALEERTRERVPLDWAQTQNNLGLALSRLGERESGTARLEEAVAAYRAALEERTRERVPLDWAGSVGNQGVAMVQIADRTNDCALAGAAVQQIEAAYNTARDGGHEAWAALFQAQLPKAKAIRDRLKGK